MIYTSYFGNMRNIPSDIIPIAITRFPPKWYEGATLKDIAPPIHLLNHYKEHYDKEYYIDVFKREVLSNLSQKDIVYKIQKSFGAKDVVLLCYEKKGDFCHRHLVSQWLRDGGFRCEEY